jgi:hypothetical protein
VASRLKVLVLKIRGVVAGMFVWAPVTLQRQRLLIRVNPLLGEVERIN